MAPRLFGDLLAGPLGRLTPDEAAACETLAAQLEATLTEYELRAVAIIDAIGYAELRPTHEAPARQQARAEAAHALIQHITTLRHLGHEPPSVLRVLQMIDQALHIQADVDEAIIGQWARRHAEQARQAREHQASDKAALRARVLRALARHPHVSQRRLAQLLDPQHPEQMRKRIARLDLMVWPRRKNKVGQSN
jgi:hypothetical protein